MTADLDLLKRLQDWYLAHCDGSWEHEHGVSIETLDNPGWHFTVELKETELFNRKFDEVRFEGREKSDWYVCRVRSHVFEGFCGPLYLGQVIAVFLDWAAGAGRADGL